MITTNIHHINGITITAPQLLEKSKSWTRDFVFSTEEGTVTITVFSDQKFNLATMEALT
jgi:hypothetical protein